jgi:hypothetical protein
MAALLGIWETEGMMTFTSHQVSDFFGVDRQEASQMIQDYLTWQRARPDGQGMRIHRVPGTRTRRALWRIGDSTRDVREMTHGMAKDVERTWQRATGKDIASAMDNNPQTRVKYTTTLRALELQIEAFVAALEAL